MTKKLLIVDDEAEICEFLKSFFEDRDFKVATAHNGAAALEQVARFEPEVVLLDIQMPGNLARRFYFEELKVFPAIKD